MLNVYFNLFNHERNHERFQHEKKKISSLDILRSVYQKNKMAVVRF